MFIGLLTVVHVVVCALLIVVVLLQKGKGQDFASTFGGGGTQTSFGARSGATILHRATTAAAVIFMLTSLSLTIMMSRGGQESVLGDVGQEATAPVAPPAQEPLPAVGEDEPGLAGDTAATPDDVTPVEPDETAPAPQE